MSKKDSGSGKNPNKDGRNPLPKKDDKDFKEEKFGAVPPKPKTDTQSKPKK